MNDRKFVSKKWGYEDWIVNNDKYCGKVLFFKKGLSCSLHYHKLKEETFYIQSGSLLVQYYMDGNADKHMTLDYIIRHQKDIYTDPIIHSYNVSTDEKTVRLGCEYYEVKRRYLEAGDHFNVPIGMRHRMTGLLDTVMFEFSTHHEDSDSYRIISS